MIVEEDQDLEPETETETETKVALTAADILSQLEVVYQHMAENAEVVRRKKAAIDFLNSEVEKLMRRQDELANDEKSCVQEIKYLLYNKASSETAKAADYLEAGDDDDIEHTF